MKRYYVEEIEVEETERERSLMLNGVMMIIFGVMAALLGNFAENFLGIDSHYLITSVLMVGGLGSFLCGMIGGEETLIEEK